jgi:hypothetical protein
MSKNFFKVIVTYDVEHKDTWIVRDVANKDEAIFAVESGKTRYYDNRIQIKEENNIEERDENSVATKVIYSVEEDDWIEKE